MKSLDGRPVIVAIAGPNGAGKSTFYQVNVARFGLRFVNADELARELEIDAEEAADMANALRKLLVERRESFVFETVFSDPVGDKVDFLRRAADDGYAVILYFIGIESAAMSEQRVAMRVARGGHDVPSDKLASRFSRTLSNLRRALSVLPHVLVYDNTDLAHGYRLVAELHDGKLTLHEPLPGWFEPPPAPP